MSNKCPWCLGEGYIIGGTFNNPWYQFCRECEGYGTVKKQVEKHKKYPDEFIEQFPHLFPEVAK